LHVLLPFGFCPTTTNVPIIDISSYSSTTMRETQLKQSNDYLLQACDKFMYVSTARRNFYISLFLLLGNFTQGCQMVYFQTKIPIWVNFGGPLQ
jgi:hypothetical protein